MWLVATILNNAIFIHSPHLINWSPVPVNWLTGQPKPTKDRSPPSSSTSISLVRVISQIGLAVVMEKIVSTM